MGEEQRRRAAPSRRCPPTPLANGSRSHRPPLDLRQAQRHQPTDDLAADALLAQIRRRRCPSGVPTSTQRRGLLGARAAIVAGSKAAAVGRIQRCLRDASALPGDHRLQADRADLEQAPDRPRDDLRACASRSRARVATAPRHLSPQHRTLARATAPGWLRPPADRAAVRAATVGAASAASSASARRHVAAQPALGRHRRGHRPRRARPCSSRPPTARGRTTSSWQERDVVEHLEDVAQARRACRPGARCRG